MVAPVQTGVNRKLLGMIRAKENLMPKAETFNRARKGKRQGKSPSTQAREFVREEFHHIREGKDGARSPQQAAAIGLSKAVKAGVKVAPPSRGRSAPKVRQPAERQFVMGGKPADPRLVHAILGILRQDGSQDSTLVISKQTGAAAQRKSPSKRSAAARKTPRAKAPALSSADENAIRTKWTEMEESLMED